MIALCHRLWRATIKGEASEPVHAAGRVLNGGFRVAPSRDLLGFSTAGPARVDRVPHAPRLEKNKIKSRASSRQGDRSFQGSDGISPVVTPKRIALDAYRNEIDNFATRDAYVRTDKASRSFFRQHFAELFAFPIDNASRRSSAGLTYWAVTMLLTRIPIEFRMSPAGNRQRSRYGGHHERRIHGASARHQSPYRRPIRQADLLHPESRRGLVPQGVELLSGGRPRGPVRLDAGVQPRGPAHPAELERTILSVRRRLQTHASPATRDSLIGAAAIRAELKSLGIRPLPFERTIERALQRTA